VPPPLCGLGTDPAAPAAAAALAPAAAAAAATAAVEEVPHGLSVEEDLAPQLLQPARGGGPLSERRARLHLAIFAGPTDQDRRSRVRQRLAAARASNASTSTSTSTSSVAPSSACFELDTLARARAPTHGFNLRAWLHYEAALHGDLSLTPLLPRGTWSAAPYPYP
jgi:hypothetical protein